MRLTIDVEQYRRLAPDVRRRFDAWLDEQGLTPLGVVELMVGEGEVVVRRHDRDADGRFRVLDDECVMVVETRRVSSLPPQEVFASSGSHPRHPPAVIEFAQTEDVA